MRGTGSSCQSVDKRHYTGIKDGWKDMEMIASNSTHIKIEQSNFGLVMGFLCISMIRSGIRSFRVDKVTHKRIQTMTLIVYLTGNTPD